MLVHDKCLERVEKYGYCTGYIQYLQLTIIMSHPHTFIIAAITLTALLSPPLSPPLSPHGCHHHCHPLAIANIMVTSPLPCSSLYCHHLAVVVIVIIVTSTSLQLAIVLSMPRLHHCGHMGLPWPSGGDGGGSGMV